MNTILANEYIHTFVYGQDFSIVDDIFHSNCIINNNFGFSFGPSIYAKKSSFWHSFKPLKLDILNEETTDNCATYHYQILLKHVEPYRLNAHKIIAPTNNESLLDVSLSLQSKDLKITKTFIASNLEETVDALVGIDKALDTNPNHNPINYCEDFLRAIEGALLERDIKLTRKQVLCLCLWFVGKSDTETAAFLKFSRSNINTQQEKIRAAFNRNNKYEVFDKIREFELEQFLYEAFILLMTHGPQY